jgi:phosphohistidine phosphatase
MLLWVVRHGIAVSRDDPRCPPDPERPLTDKGRRRMERIAEGLRRLGMAPARLISSPYLRARQTAEIVAQALDLPPSGIELHEGIEPGEDPAAILGALAGSEPVDTLLCGHAPHLDRLIARISAAAHPFTELKKGGAACLELPDGATAPGALLWLVPPSVARRMARA